MKRHVSLWQHQESDLSFSFQKGKHPLITRVDAAAQCHVIWHKNSAVWFHWIHASSMIIGISPPEKSDSRKLSRWFIPLVRRQNAGRIRPHLCEFGMCSHLDNECARERGVLGVSLLAPLPPDDAAAWKSFTSVAPWWKHGITHQPRGRGAILLM